MPLDCCSCHKCEELLWGSFFPGEEWKVKYFEGHAFQREGVWFIDKCPHYKEGKCTVHDEPWRPIQCQIYPCFLNYDGSVGVDFELCPKAAQIDEAFKMWVKSLYEPLNLSSEQFRQWSDVVGKYSEPAKRR
jgi:Fe-S-cluster containining protein